MIHKTGEIIEQNAQESQKPANAQGPIFDLQRVYVKNSSSSFTDPAETFLLKWEPAVEFEIKTNHQDLKTPNHYEVVLDGKISLKIAGRDIGTIKVEQAGIFRVEGFSDEQKKMVLNAHCQDLLYPYFCAQVARMTTDASFPALLLRPMSFVALYQQKVAQK